MKNIKIYRDSILTNEASFPTQGELDSWFSAHKAMGSFGSNESSYKRELTPAVIAENGSVVTPATFETVVVPASYTFTVTDITAQLEAQSEVQAKKDSGKKDREKCEEVLDFIAGSNRDKGLSFEQISEMQVVFANAEKALRSNRPDFALTFISKIVPDGILVTAEEKAECLSILTES